MSDLANNPLPGPHALDLATIIVRTDGRRRAMCVQAIESVLAQTYAPLELVVVEDGGERLADAVEMRRGGTQVDLHYRSIPKGGRSRAGNVGLEIARGLYLGFLDDDDAIFPTHVARLAAVLARAPETVAAYGFAYEAFVAGQDDLDRVPDERHRRVTGEAHFSLARLQARNLFPLQSVLFRRTLYERLGGFDESLDALEDWDLWLRYAAAGPFAAVPEITSMFRMPAGRAALRARQAAHDAARVRVRAKHGLAAAKDAPPRTPMRLLLNRLAGRG